MAAATQDRRAKNRGPVYRVESGSVAASTTIYAGTMVARDTAGNIVPASDTAGLVVVGVARQKVDNSTGAAGDKQCEYQVGIFAMLNDGTNGLSATDLGRWAYVADDQTVEDEGGASSVLAGRLEYVDGTDYYVEIGTGDVLSHVVSGEETVTSGALSLYKRTTLISVTGTQAYTLADGLYVGQRKSLRCTVAASTPDGTLTPANIAEYSTLGFNAVNETAELEWNGANWRLIAVSGATPA